MTTNIVTAAFGAFKVTRTRQLYQYDYGQILRFKGIDLPDAYTVHFSNQQIGGEAVKQVGNADGVLIPDTMLTNGQNVYAWVFLHTGTDDGETMYAVTIPVQQRPRPTEEEPTPVQQGLIEQAIVALNAGVEAAQEAAESVQDMGVEAETLAPGSAATVEKTVDPETSVVTLEFGIPRGAQGVPGVPGQDGVSPTATVTQTSTGATISITDAEGTTTVDITNGQDGFSPTITVTDIAGGHRVTIMDETGPHSFDVMDGTDGEDGRGIASAVLNADYTLTLTYTDGTSYTTPSIRGAKGDPGDPGEVSEEELTAKLADKADVILDTASGAIASFPDGAAVPAKDITIGIKPVQSGSGDPSPDNVRPISGWTGANVTRTGFNVWDEEWEVGIYNVNTGEKYANNNAIRTKNRIAVLPSATYYAKTPSQISKFFYDSNGDYISGSSSTSLNRTFTTPSNAHYMNFYVTSNYGTTYNHDICINLSDPSKNGTYEPGHVVTYPISWQSEAGTVYGGTLDVTTGLLTADRAMVDLGALTWANNVSGIFSTPVDGMSNANAQKVICTIYGYGVTRFNWNYADTYADKTINTATTNYIYIKDTNYNDAATFKVAMSGVQLVYELATPQTYQLTPTEVDLLLGDNNVWADTGDSTIAYRADTKLYIQKINAPTDDDMVADAQIASGKYFIVGGNLYKSTTTIPAGDTITPGTNCVLTNLADALNALNA